MNVIKMAACMSAMLIMTTSSLAQGWRGIAPIRSTCEDVKRILAVDTCEPSTYRLDGETVEIDFEKYSCEQRGGWNVPVGTVLEITRTLHKPRPLAEFRVDEGKYEKVFTDFLDEVIYANGEEGIDLTTVNGEVRRVTYYPGAKNEHLRCPNAPALQPDVSALSSLPSMFDTYGALSFDEEKQRLDAFAQALLEYAPDSQGYILVYAGRRARKDEAQARAKRAKEYVVKTHGIKESRIGTVDGGHLEELQVELYVGPRGLPAPMTFPSIHPSEVQIIKDDGTRVNNRRSSQPPRKRRQPYQ